jgi:hypothetical protein
VHLVRNFALSLVVLPFLSAISRTQIPSVRLDAQTGMKPTFMCLMHCAQCTGLMCWQEQIPAHCNFPAAQTGMQKLLLLPLDPSRAFPSLLSSHIQLRPLQTPISTYWSPCPPCPPIIAPCPPGPPIIAPCPPCPPIIAPCPPCPPCPPIIAA